MSSADSYKTQASLSSGSKTYTYFSLQKLAASHPSIQCLPFSLRILLENLLRHEDGVSVKKEDIQAIIDWDPKTKPTKEISFRPARVILQDFTGVPAVVDLAAMREAIQKLGGDPKKINPLQPVDLVIDHSVQVDFAGTADSLQKNADLEFERNQERYRFLRWGSQAFDNFRVVPPDTGIVHQVNLEYLAHGVMTATAASAQYVYPDTLVGTDSHTTMINGLGVVGWGVGGIEAEAAMLGQPISMLIPEVIGFNLKGKLPEGATATDLVLTITQMLRKKGVVGKFVEFYGSGLKDLSLPDRATVANMAPEYGATIGFFPVDGETVRYLEFTGRAEAACLLNDYTRAQDLFRTDQQQDPIFSDTLELDLSTVVPCLAGPKRPQDRVNLPEIKTSFLEKLPEMKPKGETKANSSTSLKDGDIVIAAITSCTNTSNPSVLIAAGLLAQKAVEKGLISKPWVKTSLAPGSQVVTEYLGRAGLLSSLEKLGFYVVGYGCTTCIGNSGPLDEKISENVRSANLVVASVLSGNRNFEGRINPDVRANYLASPPLVVAYALAGSITLDLKTEALGKDAAGNPVFLKDIWPSQNEITESLRQAMGEGMFAKTYSNVFLGDAAWQKLAYPKGEIFEWDTKSTYVKHPPYFENFKSKPDPVQDLQNARVLALLGDSVTTDHISPAGSIKTSSPAGVYLQKLGVQPVDFNSYGARRGNHEVMVRGTFANIRIKNLLVPGTEGGVTLHLPGSEQLSIYDAAMRYREEKVPLIVIAGKEYGTGSSRDWAAKGTALLGVKAVLAESFERIHRSNLVGMGILPLQFKDGENAQSLQITGHETFSIDALSENLKPLQPLTLRIISGSQTRSISVILRMDTPYEIEYFRHGGILPYVLRQLVG